MKKTRHWLKKATVLLCILFLLLYISVAFFPHAHESRDADCALCALLQSSRDILYALALCALLYHFCGQSARTLVAHHRVQQIRDITPVGLKVKLSD